MNKQEAEAKLLAALNELGSTEAEVFSRLSETEEEGAEIRGFAGNSCECPVANYLRHRDLVSARVNIATASACVEGVNVTVRMPPAVRSFVDSFDFGQFKSLRKEPSYNDADEQD